MKSENGVTLVALITIIIVLIIMMTIGIYSGTNSYKVIKLEKNIAELREIQIEIDRLYEESKIYLQDNEGKNYFDDKLSLKNHKTSNVKAPAYINNINKFVNNNNVNIDKDTVMNGYYILHKDTLENKLKIDTINVSDYFIINFEKRLVFLVKPLKIVNGKNEDGTNKINEIYSLYQLDDEEKVISLKTDGEFKYSIIKEDYKQNIKITHDVGIEKIELILKSVNEDGTENESYVNINERKDYCTKLTGLGTGTVNIEIIKDCIVKITDVLGNEKIKTFRLYNTPILEKNMIPFIPEYVYNNNIKQNGGLLCYYYSPEWYDYNDIEDIKFATAVLVSENSIKQYKENISDTVRTTFPINSLEVKVWIPKNLAQEIKDKYVNNLKYDVEKDFENVTGIWVNVEYVNDKYIPKQY